MSLKFQDAKDRMDPSVPFCQPNLVSVFKTFLMYPGIATAHVYPLKPSAFITTTAY